MMLAMRNVTILFCLLCGICRAESVPVDFSELSIRAAQHAMHTGAISAEQLTDYYLKRIERYNPTLNAVIAVNPAALDEARRLDAERAAGRSRGPLHGIPILLKDNIESKEPGLATTAGALALQHNVTARDAFVSARLRAAGAIILGKANLSEWANFRSTRSSSGWSGLGGQTRNPHDLNRSPCGSSSGSGSAVAADLALAAIGTETDGSITCPASSNGIVGLKPTVGLLSRAGIVPISHRQDTAGPMTRSVHDAAVLMNVLAAFDPDDSVIPETRHASLFNQDYAAGLEHASLEGKRIGVLRSMAEFHEGVSAVFDQAVRDLQAGGAIIVDDLRYASNGDAFADNQYGNALRADFKHTINAYLADVPQALAVPRSLAALIEFNEAHADTEMKWFQQELFIESQAMPGVSDPDYVQSVEKMTTVTRSGIDTLLEEHRLDALIAPSTGVAWMIDRINGDHFVGSGSSSYPAIAGYPNLTVPMGYVHHLPVGIAFIGGAFSEAELLAIGHAYELRTHHRRTPSLTSGTNK